ncbi:Ribosome-binding protein 1 [Nosema granulosis]|uniref:Ribosome-binding protein 1 n=1 Tax=Nosema granulosis TaxID=83296 RepID=A0A9P6GWP0_9MICR|nr:Ribosome-binding protein 1 [Nosema granulosis]
MKNKHLGMAVVITALSAATYFLVKKIVEIRSKKKKLSTLKEAEKGYNSKNYEKSIAQYKEALVDAENHREKMDICNGIAKCLIKIKKYEEALEYLNLSLNIDLVNNLKALKWRSECYKKTGNKKMHLKDLALGFNISQNFSEKPKIEELTFSIITEETEAFISKNNLLHSKIAFEDFFDSFVGILSDEKRVVLKNSTGVALENINNNKPSEMIQNNNKLAKMIQNNNKPAEMIQNNNKPAEMTQNNNKLAEMIQNNNKLAEMIQNNNKLAEMIQNNNKPSEMIQNNNKPSEMIQNNNKLAKMIQNNNKPAEMIKNNNKPSEMIQNNNKLAEMIKNNNKPSEMIQNNNKLAEMIKNNNKPAEMIKNNNKLAEMIQNKDWECLNNIDNKLNRGLLTARAIRASLFYLKGLYSQALESVEIPSNIFEILLKEWIKCHVSPYSPDFSSIDCKKIENCRNPTLVYFLSKLYLFNKNVEEYLRLIRLILNHSFVYYDILIFYKERQNHKMFKKYAEEALCKFKNNPKCLAICGEYAMAAKDQKYLNWVLNQMDDENTRFLLFKANYFFNQNDLKSAFISLRKTLALDPTCFKAYFNLGELVYSSSPRDSKKIWKEALSHASTYNEVINIMHIILSTDIKEYVENELTRLKN